MQPDQNQDWQRPKELDPRAPYQVMQDENREETYENVDDTVASEDSADTPEEAYDEDSVLLRWTGTEYIYQEQSGLWYAIAVGVALVFMIIALVWFRSVTFAILIPVMLVSLIVYVRRPPATIQYILSRKGLHVDDRLFPYSQFKSFGVVTHQNHHSVVLVPRKRFQIGQAIYFPEEIGEQLVDMLAARLPMKDVKLDFIDHMLTRLHL